jgi:Ca-activated chloride channel family protein
MRAVFRTRFSSITAAATVVFLAACGGGGSTPSPSPTPEPSAPASTAPSVEASASETAGGPAAITAPDEVEAGVDFEVEWTGPDAQGDYITLVPAGATEWTFTDPYFNTNVGPTGTLVAPTTAGAYEIWYVNGADDSVAVSVDITVTPFTGSLLADDEVPAGAEFEVAWNGPDGPGDYVTIVPKGATQWTGADDYFNTTEGSPSTLVAPIEDGEYEIWYVTGSDAETQATRPITVLPLAVTLDAPDRVNAGEEFDVAWTGPDGPSDYITIVLTGSAEGSYNDYEYTTAGPTVTIRAPDAPGNYEIWYASDRVPGTFESIPIIVE